jgi:hypothetical protein
MNSGPESLCVEIGGIRMLRFFSVFTVFIALFLTGCESETVTIEAEEVVEENIYREPAPEPIPELEIPADAPVVTIEVIPEKDVPSPFNYGFRVRSEPAPNGDMVVRVREIWENTVSKKKNKYTLYFIIGKGQQTSPDFLALGKKMVKVTATVFLLPNPLPELPLKAFTSDYLPPNKNTPNLELPEGYEFVLYHVGEPSTITFNF